MAEVSVREAARRLGVSERRTREMLRDKELVGRQIDGFIWQVDENALQDRIRIEAGAGRPWAAHTVCSIAAGLSEGKRIEPKVSARLRTTETEQLWRKMAQSFTVRKYNARDAERVREHLALTGESALDKIGEKLVGQSRTLHGYLRGIELEELIDEAGLVESSSGNVTIYLAKSGSCDWVGEAGDYALSSLVAVDCARSANTRVRSAGVRALDEMKGRWLARTS